MLMDGASYEEWQRRSWDHPRDEHPDKWSSWDELDYQQKYGK